ncbi:MAG: DISARM system phospholipase D-like protein DrmC [Thermoanaerobaculia bacterium]
MTEPSFAAVARAAWALSRTVPTSVLDSAAMIISAATEIPEARLAVATQISHPDYRARVTEFLRRCEALGDIKTGSVAAALATAAEAERDRRLQPVELVWTGPDPGVLPFRKTEQAVLEVLDGAKKRILLVSYAVYAIPRIREALVRAARRGVRITVVIETPNLIDGKAEYSTLRALGSDVAAVSSVFYWPAKKRSPDGGKAGILHVKCAVGDGKTLFLSSANLTEYAFTINMELGALFTGGALPREVEKHFDGLIENGTLEKLD